MGHVRSEKGDTLIGATVRVVGSVIGASTDLDGKFRLGVPPGRIRLLVTYIGYENYDTTLRVSPLDREIEVDIELREDFAEVGEVIVFGRRATGQAQALRVQQSALINQTIVHADLFNKYPDVTLAETVQRMPGVTITRNQGEAERVQVRGLPEQYTAISVNGQRLPAVQPDGDRAGGLDIIQSNLVEEVRIVKSRTADLDADAIGGTVDFRLRQPEERFELLAQGGLGKNFGYDDGRGGATGITQVGGYLNSELKDEGVYFLVGGSYFRHGRGNTARRFDYGRDGATGQDIIAARPYDLDRDSRKVGFLGSIELRPSIYNRLRLSYNHSRSNEDYLYRQANFRNVADGFAGAPVPSVSRTTSQYTQERVLNLVTLEVENNFPKARLDYAVSFANATDAAGDRLRVTDRTLARSRGALTQPEFANLDPRALPTGDPVTERIRYQENSDLAENIAIGGINFTRYVSDSKTSFLRAGLRYRVKDRSRGSFFLRQPQGSPPPPPAGQAFPEPPTEALTEAPDRRDRDDAYDATEEIYGGYLMYAANWSSRLTSSLGVRYERTDLDFELGQDEGARNNSYDNWFPSLNLTYRVRRDRQLRFSYFTAIARPGYANLVPNRQRQVELDEIIRGEFTTAPTTSHNLDLTFERYGRRDGLFEVGLFAKFLDNPTVRNSITEELDELVYRVTTVQNTDQAHLFGFEMGFYQNLGFISPVWRFFNVNGTYNFNILDVESRNVMINNFTLPQAPRQSANFSILYSTPENRLNLVLAANFRDRVFDRIQDGEPLYRNSRVSLDVSGDVELFRNLSVYTRINNLTDHAYEEWIDEPNNAGARLLSTTNFGTWGVLGLRYRP